MQTNVLQSNSRAGERTLIDELIDEQRSLTAVDRFSQKHDLHELPTQAQYYRDLIPLAAPQPGEQFAFEVNLDQCSGCKACVTACHGLNGLDDDETWRDTGLLHGGTRSQPIQQHVTTACHHCVDPACLNGCPVLAYDKDPVTGIVRHLDDQCIGCQYCVLKCPYDVPKYSARRGIVRKCDMCSHRLAVGEAPACVQACPTEAIRITIVNQGELVGLYRDNPGNENKFLPESPAPEYTAPTTRYVSARRLAPDLQPGDANRIEPQPAHLPLVFMLVLTQLSVGAFAMDLAVGQFLPAAGTQGLRSLLELVAALACFAGLAVSVGHLGRPLGAWRAFLGLKKSWLSREIVVFGLFATLACAFGLSVKFPLAVSHALKSVFLAGTVLSGLAGVFCSAMIYHDTQREFWALAAGGPKFFGTVAILGLAAALAGTAVDVAMVPGMAGALLPWLGRLALALALATAIKLGQELAIFKHLDQENLKSLGKSAWLLSEPLRPVAAARLIFGLVGGVLLPFLLCLEISSRTFTTGATDSVLSMAAASFALLLCGELLERLLFFKAVAPARMPGGVAS